MKQCKICGQNKPLNEFHRWNWSKDNYRHQCKECANKQRRKVAAEKRAGTFVSRVRKPRLTEEDRKHRQEEIREYMKHYREDNYDKIAAAKRAGRDRAKEEGIRHYGGKCSCCGESEIKFLTIEHLNGRENEKGKRRTGKEAWLRARREGYPDNYTVLCFNCNCAKGVYGKCPHQKET